MTTTGHLCSGYDGLGRGLGLLRPHETLWHAESDPDMSSVLAKHEPDVRNVGDLTLAPWDLAPVPDVVTAGIPCQPISINGHGRGETDKRYLWPYAVEIFRTVRPPFILLENVERLLTIKLRSGHSMLDRWLADLRELRYRVRWTVIGACVVGAPHHRHRFYAWCEHLPVGPVPRAERVLVKCGAPRGGGRLLLPTPVTSDTNGPGRTGNRHGGKDLRTTIAELPVGSWGPFAGAVAEWESITGYPAPEATEPGERSERRLSALLPEWMMGVEPGLLTGHLPRAAAIKGAGNGAVPQQAAAAVRLLG